MSGRARRAGLGLFLAALLGAAPALAGDAELFRPREPGETLPAMTLHDLEGRPRTLEPGRLEGPVLLFFWSVYCPNCKEAMPGLVELYDSDPSGKLVVWAVNVDGERFSNGVAAYTQETRLPFPVVYDRLEGEYLVAADPLGVSKTPTLYVVGADGRIALRQMIRMDFEAVRKTLATLR